MIVNGITCFAPSYIEKTVFAGGIMRRLQESRHEDSQSRFRQFWRRLLAVIFGRKSCSQADNPLQDEEEEFSRENPYLHKFSIILQQILERYHMPYREFRPLLVDTDMPPESLLDEDQVEVMLEQISEDLNFLRIVTDRPAYFTDYIQRMYEDSGLVVQICSKEDELPADFNVILDMEYKGDCPLKCAREDMLYIPVYKRVWTSVENMGNLDIAVPIGYNTVIVKGVL